MSITVAVDAMGGDHGPTVTVPAALQFLQKNPEISIILVGVRQSIEAALVTYKSDNLRLKIQDAAEIVGMDESPLLALKNKKKSSMRVAIDLVKQGEAKACVSAGNTGALMAIAKFVLKTLPGIERPAIAKFLPTLKDKTCVLDLGANVDSTPTQLLQFGIMGAILSASLFHKSNPSVGLLNIGTEEIKGNEIVKEAAELLKKSSLNFYGNVEGDDIYKGTTDVVVCDGFAGNVALKTSEGVAQMLAAFLRQEFTRNGFTQLLGFLAKPVLNAFKRRVDPRYYNGASLVGLRGIVIKSHGSADCVAFEYALAQAVEEAKNDVVKQIAEKVAALIPITPPVIESTV